MREFEKVDEARRAAVKQARADAKERKAIKDKARAD